MTTDLPDDVTLLHGDCIDVMWTIDDNTIDAICTDPPYGLEFMGKDWDSFRTDRRQPGDDNYTAGPGPYGRSKVRYGSASSYGDTSAAMSAFGAWCEQWATECLRVLKPGGHLLAFGGSRTWHRLAVGVEDAGFEIRDSIAWLYGSGFPKSRDVTESMNRYLAGESPTPTEVVIRPGLYEVTGFLRAARDAAGWTNKRIDALFGTNGMAGHWTSNASQPACPSVRQWQILKEGMGFGDDMDELVEQLAATERPEDYGQGAGRDGPFLDTLHKNGDFKASGAWGTALKPAFEPVVVARKPIRGSVSSNVLVHGTGALNIDGCRVDADDIGALGRDNKPGDNGWKNSSGGPSNALLRQREGLEPQGRWPTNVVLDDTQAAELDRQAGQRGAGNHPAHRESRADADTGVYQFGHTGTESERRPTQAGGASRYFPTFRYTPKASTAERPSADGTAHPTVKPRELMGWLIRLVTPPGGLVLDPFAGSGTTIEAALREGKRAIGIERDANYIALIHDRLSRTQHGFDLGVS